MELLCCQLVAKANSPQEEPHIMWRLVLLLGKDATQSSKVMCFPDFRIWRESLKHNWQERMLGCHGLAFSTSMRDPMRSYTQESNAPRRTTPAAFFFSKS